MASGRGLLIDSGDRHKATIAAKLAIKNQVGTQATHEFARMLLDVFTDLDEAQRLIAAAQDVAERVREQNSALTKNLMAVDAERTRLLDLVNTFQVRSLGTRLEKAEARVAVCVRALEQVIKTYPWPLTMRRLAREALGA